MYDRGTNSVSEMYEARYARPAGMGSCCEGCAENARLLAGSACMSCGRPVVVAAGVAGDTSVPDPLHPNCIITFHCDNRGHNCTSSSSCGGVKAAQMLGTGGVPDAMLGFGASDHAYGVSGAGGDLMDIAFQGYRCAADGPAPVGAGDLVDAVDGEPMRGDGCNSCGPTIQQLIDAEAGVAGLPAAGLGVTAAQIDADLVRANTLAAAHTLVTDDFTDAVTACDTAITDTIAAEQALTSNPSASIIGMQSGIVTKLLADRAASSSRCTTGDYDTAYTAATNAYQAYLKDSALPANVTPSPTPAPAPPPAPPIVVLPTPTPGVTPAPATPPSDTSYATPVLVGAGIIGLSLVGYAAYKRYYAGAGRKSFSRAKTRVPSGRTAHSARKVRA